MSPSDLRRQLVEDVADGIRILRTRDNIDVPEDIVYERARNIVAGLVGNYDVDFPDDEDEDDEDD